MAHLLLTHLHALFSVLATSIRLRRIERDTEFDELVAVLRSGRVFPGWARDPKPYARLTNRLLRWLPPRDVGPCYKSSLILLHLWTRCGLEPELHLGVRRSEENPFEGHAWITATLRNGDVLATRSSGYEAHFTFGIEKSAPTVPTDPQA